MSNLTKEELLKIVTSKVEDLEAPKKNNEMAKAVSSIVELLGFNSGTTKIPNYLIYYMYAAAGGKYGKSGFFREFSKKFKSYRIGKSRYYLLSSNGIDLSRENLEKAKHFNTIKYSNGKKSKKKL